jgi:hypothetical protein
MLRASPFTVAVGVFTSKQPQVVISMIVSRTNAMGTANKAKSLACLIGISSDGDVYNPAFRIGKFQ